MVLALSFDAFGAQFKFRLLAEPTTFDWHQASTAMETPIMMNIMEGLMEVDQALKPKGCLAEKVVISKDQKTYTFHLRKGVKWSDGVALKAQDFVEGWKRLLTPATAAPYAYLLYDVMGAEAFNKGQNPDFATVGVVAKDEATLVVTLKQPVAYFQYLTGFWPLFPIRKDQISQGNQWTKPKKLVSIGPYVLDAYQVQTRIILKKNPHYWRPIGSVDEAVALIIKDSATALNVFKTGGIQMMQDFSPDDLKLARPMPEFQTFPYLKTHYLGFKVKGTIAENKNLRLAITHAIDRKPIPGILNGSQKIASTIIPPKVVGYDAKITLPFDVAKAKEFLKKSGIDPAHEKIEIIARNSERPRILTQYIQSELKKNLGLMNVQIANFDHKVFRSQVSTGNFPMMLMVWAADYPDGDSFMGLFESNTGNNMTRFSDVKVDEEIRKGREESNPSKREKLYQSAQRVLQVRDAAILPLFYEENEVLVSKSIRGFAINPIGYYFIKDIQ